MSCALAAVDVQDLSGRERRRLEIQDSADHILDLANPADGVQRAHPGVGALVVRGVLITPRETAFTRRPREAYSIASDLVTATNPPW